MRFGRFATGVMVALGVAAGPVGAQTPSGVQVRLGTGLAWIGSADALDPGRHGRLALMPGTSWTAAVPGWLRWALQPQVQTLNVTTTGGGTLQGYRGLSWSVPLTGGLLHQDDTLSFGFTVGQGLGDLNIASDPGDRRMVPSMPYLRLGAAVGYQVTPRIGLYVLFDHLAGGGPTHEEESQNDLGIRVGLRF